jgi:hypothetical protein
LRCLSGNGSKNEKVAFKAGWAQRGVELIPRIEQASGSLHGRARLERVLIPFVGVETAISEDSKSNGSLEALLAWWLTEDHRAMSIAKYSGHSWPGQSDWGQECPQYAQKPCLHERQGSILHRLKGSTINALRD